LPSAGAAAGERLSPTQQFSVGMPSFGGPRWRERDMWGLTPWDQLWCRVAFRRARYEGTMTPPGVTPGISYPGYLGGVDWGSISVNKDLSLLIVNSNRVGNYNQLVPRAIVDKMGVKASIGGGPLLSYGLTRQKNTPFVAKIRPFLSPLGVPCNEPPYGLISAVDLRTHKLLWSKRLGSAEDSGPMGFRSHIPFAMGLPNAGGSITTRGGLVFIAATQSPILRAPNVRTGEQV
jgi:quinoprotein glucose dehydrogenase